MSISICFGQQENKLINKFNKNAASFLNIKFGSPIPYNITIDSVKRNTVFYSFDKQKHIEEESRFKGKSFGFNANYYALEIDSNIHLIQIQYQDIDTIQSQYLIDSISTLLLPVHFKQSTELFYFEEEICTTLCWIKYEPDKMKLILQISDMYYCERLEF